MSDLENKMNSAVSHFEKELNSLRTSRANPSMLDNILVDSYGSKTPLNQLSQKDLCPGEEILDKINKGLS